MMMRQTAAGLVAAAILVVAGSASAQSYSRTTSSRTFSSISLTGTFVSMTDYDEGYGSFVSPFSFDVYGSPSASTLYVGSNGTLHFDSGYATYTNAAIPSSATPNLFVAPFWDDLYLANGGVYYQTSGSAGSRVLIIEWYNAAQYAAQTDSFSFQLRIYEGTDVIEFSYGSRSITGVWDGTVGVEASGGLDGTSEICSPACTPSSVTANTVITLTPSTVQPTGVDFDVYYVDSMPVSVAEGSAVTLNYEIYNGGFDTSPAGEMALYIGSSVTPSPSDVEIGYSSFSGIVSGNYGYGSFSLSIPTGYAGTWYVGAIVDPFNSVTETSETNNAYSIGTVTITTVGGSIVVTTGSLPAGQIGASYNTQLQQSGAVSPYWYLSSGSLPPGLSLSTTGLISGVPSTDGLYTFRVQAEEGVLTPGYADLAIEIGGGGTIQITTTTLPDGELGVPYQASVTATGGIPPYAFQIISGRPSWLSLDSAGNFTGTPDVEGSSQLTISVFDSTFADATATLTLAVVQPSAMEIVTEVPAAVTGRPYSQRIITGGVPPYQITTSNGDLPAGLTLSDAGYLAGTPTTKGTAHFTLTVSDSATPQGSAEGDVTIEVVELTTLDVKLRELVVFVNANLDTNFEASGGVPPYSWVILSGALLPGMTFDATGHLGGKVTMVGNVTLNVMVTDSEGSTATADVALRATVFRAPGSRGDTGRRRRGCVCAESAASGETGSALWVLVIGLAFVAGRRVDKRRGNSP